MRIGRSQVPGVCDAVKIERGTHARGGYGRHRRTLQGRRRARGLRHTFISNLARGGVHPKIAQQLARHSTITLTLDRYTHSITGDLASALDVLPSMPTEAAAVAATGTDDHTSAISPGISEKHSAKGITGSARFPAQGANRHQSSMNEPYEKRQEMGKSSRSVHRGSQPFRDQNELGRSGLEPPTHGFSVRCSTN